MSIHRDLKYRSHVLMIILTESKKKLISLNLCIWEGTLIGILDYAHMTNTYFSVLNNHTKIHSNGCSGICSMSIFIMLCLQSEAAKFLSVREVCKRYIPWLVKNRRGNVDRNRRVKPWDFGDIDRKMDNQKSKHLIP